MGKRGRPAPKQHAWEDEDRGHRWEGDAREGASDDEPVAPEQSPAAAAEAMMDILLGLYFTSMLSAEKLCAICYFAGLSGMPETASRLGFRPSAPTGHYQRFLDAQLEFSPKRQRLYHVDICGQRKHDLGRTAYTVPMMPLHEVIQQEINDNPALPVKLAEAVADGLPLGYHRHPATRAHPGEVLPLGLYGRGPL